MGLFLYLLLGLVNLRLAVLPFSLRSALLLAYFKSVPLILSFVTNANSFSGLRRSLRCVYRAWLARQFVQEHRLQLDRGAAGVTLSEQGRDALPAGYGFEFPLASLLFSIVVFGLILLNFTDD